MEMCWEQSGFMVRLLQVESRSCHTRLPVSQIIEVFAPTGLLGLHQGCCDLPTLHVCAPVEHGLDGARSLSEFLLSPPHLPCGSVTTTFSSQG